MAHDPHKPMHANKTFNFMVVRSDACRSGRHSIMRHFRIPVKNAVGALVVLRRVASIQHAGGPHGGRRPRDGHRHTARQPSRRLH